MRTISAMPATFHPYNSDEKPRVHANEGSQKKPTIQKGYLIGDGKFSGRNPPFVCISAD
jgi:hypothetical protein